MGWSESIRNTLIALRRIYVKATFVIPFGMIFVFMEFALVWLIPINEQTVYYFYYAQDVLHIPLMYITMWTLFSLVFGYWQVQKYFIRFTVPLMSAHLIMHGIRYHFGFSFLRPIYYCLFILHYYCILRSLGHSKKPEHLTPSQAREYSITKDGTTTAMARGEITFFLTYLIFNFMLFPIYDDSTLIVKILIRSCIFSPVVAIVDHIQHQIFMGLSLDMMGRRFLQNTVSYAIFITIGRMMTSSASSWQGNVLLSATSGIIEIFFRLSYQARQRWASKCSFYYEQVLQCFKQSREVVRSSRIVSKINNLEDCHEHAANTSQSAGSSEPASDEGSQNGTRKILDPVQYIRRNRTRMCRRLMVAELQAIFIVPTTLFVVKPLRDYLLLDPIPDFSSLFQSILIQLAMSFPIDFICVLYEIRYLGLNYMETFPARRRGAVPWRELLFLSIVFYVSYVPFVAEPEAKKFMSYEIPAINAAVSI
eukprot:TRINITY_DN7320_c0_g1_i2.p1 TRINITY_DN7320_c0_g1~~TRINITY_DN7320_c0_g1_i2.p1  ORF type:complete len:479 (+),score=64.40 TRINITY_DN7320_c0_g1_i2:395-1831(+)